jgi:two-component system, chemotaxis family, protein-glutamate methylesterase/glutaminase
MIRVLIVEDSYSVRLLLKKILEMNSEIVVSGMATSGEEALEFLKKKSSDVDVITMDIILPGIDGFETTKKIMASTPKPIVVVSGTYKNGETEKSFKAIEAGAVTIIEKPVVMTHPAYPRIKDNLINTVKLMSEVKVVTHFNKRESSKKKNDWKQPRTSSDNVELMIIGASTGGPPVIRTVLREIIKKIDFPILVVQHISIGFGEGFAQWLSEETGFSVHVPLEGERCLPGHVYIAPDDYHMGIDEKGCIALSKSIQENRQRPSVSYLFRSALHYCPKNTLALLLTGMGNDGAAELKQLKEAGAITIAQNESSSVVFGMPGEAVKLDAAKYVLPPQDIVNLINEITKTKQNTQTL